MSPSSLKDRRSRMEGNSGLRIPARRAEYSLTESALSPFQANNMLSVAGAVEHSLEILAHRAELLCSHVEGVVHATDFTVFRTA